MRYFNMIRRAAYLGCQHFRFYWIQKLVYSDTYMKLLYLNASLAAKGIWNVREKEYFDRAGRSVDQNSHDSGR